MIHIHNSHNVLSTEDTFGTLEIETLPSEITSRKTVIHLMLDISASMDERTSDGNSKLYQIQHVTRNILRYISTKCLNGNVSVTLSTFNTSINTLFEDIVVTADNLQELILKINDIYADDETNIQLALKHISAKNTPYTHNIFMSDGDANKGEMNPDKLAKYVEKHAASNTFVGFGLHHNPQIFTTLSSATPTSEYYFIDMTEKAGLAYGEILHKILYNQYRNVRIDIVGGTIYDWKLNEWTTYICVGDLAGDTKKTFHISTPDPSKVMVLIGRVDANTGESSEDVATWDGEKTDLTKYVFRHRTQVLMYEAKRKEPKEIKSRIVLLLKEVKDYIQSNNLGDDALLQNLCDDLVIVHRTIGTRFGTMYSNQRQSSQGNQRTFNVFDTPTRCHADEVDFHTVSGNVTPFLSPQATAVMHDVTVSNIDHFDTGLSSIDTSALTNVFHIPFPYIDVGTPIDTGTPIDSPVAATRSFSDE